MEIDFDFDDNYPWFSTSTGLVQFLVFEERLRVLDRLLTRLDEAVCQLLEAEHDGAAKQANPSPEMVEAGGLHPDLAEWSHAWDSYHWARDFIPTFAFGSTVAQVLAALEVLLTSLVNGARMRGGLPPPKGHGARIDQHSRLSGDPAA